MPKWKDAKARDRLLAALVASIDKKSLNYRKIATYYGEGTTYDAIEGQFRSIRKIADGLREAVGSGEQVEAPARGMVAGSTGSSSGGGSFSGSGSGSMGLSARKTQRGRGSGTKRDGVITGRVTKSKSITPTKQWTTGENAVKGVKEEIISSESSIVDPMENFDANAAYAQAIGFDGAFDFDHPDLIGSFDGADLEWGV